MEFVISVAGAVIFCGFIIFDTHLIMHKLSPEEYILASVNLYLDFLNLFLYVLRILQAMRREWTNSTAFEQLYLYSSHVYVFITNPCICVQMYLFISFESTAPKNLLNTDRSSSQGRNL